MKARGQATGASTTMHTLMIHTVLAPNLQTGMGLSYRLLCFKHDAEKRRTPDRGSLMRYVYLLHSCKQAQAARSGAHQRPCRLQKA